MASLFSIEKQMNAYAPYHQNKINQWIHIICVPIIFWTALVFVNKFVPAFFETDLGFGLLPYGPFVINGAFVGTTLFVLFYIILEPLAGVLNPSPLQTCFLYVNPFVFSCRFSMRPSSMVFATQPHIFPTPTPMPFQFLWSFTLLAGSCSSWAIGFAEGRSPALIDSFVQAPVLAPLFVWLEVLFMLGYKPELNKRIVDNARKNIAAWKQSKAKKAH